MTKSSNKSCSQASNGPTKLIKKDQVEKNKKYSKFQYRDQVFQIGDSCKFWMGDKHGDVMGKILGICTTDQKHPDFGKLNVAWYYFKNELDFKTLGLKQKEQDAIAEHQEIFLTNHTDKVWVQSINAKIEILSLEEFDKLSVVPPTSYLCRADYDVKKIVLKPPFNKWGGRSCSCNMPTNPLQ